MIEKELNEFNRIIAILESHLNLNNQKKSSTPLTLKRIYIWTLEPLQKFRTIQLLINEEFEKSCTLINSLHTFALHGNPQITSFMHRVLEQITQPLMHMIYQWTSSGILEDPYSEFFIVPDDLLKLDSSMQWNQTYSINYQKCPGFLPNECIERIYLTGKNLNFIKYACGDSEFVKQFSGIYSKGINENKLSNSIDLFSYQDLTLFYSTVDAAHEASNEHFLNLLFKKFNYKETLHALKQYLLLGAGDFITTLLTELE